jgi:hypothetical protein
VSFAQLIAAAGTGKGGASASGAPAQVTLSPAAGTAAQSGGGSVSATATPAQIYISAATGSANGWAWSVVFDQSSIVWPDFVPAAHRSAVTYTGHRSVVNYTGHRSIVKF